MSFQDLKTKYDLEKKDYIYMYDTLQIRAYFTREIRSEPEETSNNVICVIADAYKQNGPQVISVFYQALEEGRGDWTLYIKVKWERELKIQIT